MDNDFFKRMESDRFHYKDMSGGADFELSDLSGSRFENCDLRGASLSLSDLRRATFERCDFSGSFFASGNFSDATFDRCTFLNCRIEGGEFIDLWYDYDGPIVSPYSSNHLASVVYDILQEPAPWKEKRDRILDMLSNTYVVL